MSLLALFKALQLLGTVLVTSGPVFEALVWRPALAVVGKTDSEAMDTALRHRLWAVAAAGALLLTGGWAGDLFRIAGALSGGPWIGGEPFAKLLLFMTETNLGRFLALRPVLLVITVWAAARATRVPRWLAAFSSLALLATFSLTSHSFSGTNSRLGAVLADLMHLTATSVWYGGVICLVLLPWQTLWNSSHHEVLPTVVNRFSNVGVMSVLVLTGTGTLMGSNRLYGTLALVEHPYGQTLFLKLAFFAGVLALAGFNLLVVRPSLGLPGTRADWAARRLRWLVVGEAVLGLVVVAAAGVLSSTAPPKGEPVRLTVTLADGEILPRSLDIPRNQPVLLTVTNRSTTLHTYVIRSIPHEMIGGGHQHGNTQDMVVFVDPGRRGKVQFIPLRPGQYSVYCMMAGHLEAGETAVVTVR